MRRNIKGFFLLSFLLIFVASLVILLMGNTYTVAFHIKDNHYEVSLHSNDIVEIIDEKEKNDLYFVTVKAKHSGRTYLLFNNGGFMEERVLYVHKNMVITDNNFFGYSRGSEVIPISISIIILYFLLLFFKEYKKGITENMYQYKNVVYLGIIIFISIFLFNNILSIIHYNGLFETINKTISLVNAISIYLLPIFFITFILVTISNMRLIRREGMSLRNLLGLFLGIFILVLTFLPDYIYNVLQRTQSIDIYNLNSIGPYLYNFFESVIYLIVSYLECILIGTIIMALKVIKKRPIYNKDYVIILGCQIKKDGSLTPLLKGRVDRAIQFREEQLKNTGKDLIFIPSGGKGNDEVISEAEAMKNYLLEQGIKEKNILVENQSKNTYENIDFSYRLIKKKNANVVFSTTNYHVFRAGLLATGQGFVLEGIGSRTKAYFWVNAFIREFIGTIYSEKKKHLLVFLIILIIISIMISITYFANNL